MEEIVKNEFQFYSKLAKPLILNLPKSKDRILAAAWIKKFMDEKAGEEKLRTTYLKLLLFCLQRRKLTGIFSDDPVIYDVLEELPAEYDLNQLAKNLLEQEQMEKKERYKLEMMGDMAVFPAYTTDCSPDLTEYVAAQDIPNFGVHAYYAISKQPVNKWQNSDKAILPKGTRSAIDTSIMTAAGQLTADPCVCGPKGAASAPDVEDGTADNDLPECKKRKHDKEPEKKRKKPQKMGQSPPSRPIGEVHHKDEDDRLTPTWGTNLLDVKETTDIGKKDEPTEVEIELEEEANKILENDNVDVESIQESEGETDKAAEEMQHIVKEYNQNKLDKQGSPGDYKKKKRPNRTKQTKVNKRNNKFGTRPDNLPPEYADWTEKDLEEAGLRWEDLVPVDDNIDAELQRIEDEEMAGLEDEDIPIDDNNPYEGLTDYDALLREAEEDLERCKTAYDAELEEDVPVVENFDDQILELEDELNVAMTAEEIHRDSPALTAGIPVTTPHHSPSPKRDSRTPCYAEDDDVLLQPRTSPLQAPKRTTPEKQGPDLRSLLRSGIPSPKSSKNKDRNIANVFRSANAAVDEQPILQRGRGLQDDEDEFTRLERQFAEEEGERWPRSPRRQRSPEQFQDDTQRVLQRAQQQEQLLISPPAVDPAYAQFATEYGDAQGGLDEELCLPCSPPPLGSPQAHFPIPDFNYERNDVASPDRFDYLNRPPPTTPEYIQEARRRAQMDPNEFQFVRDYDNVQVDGEEEQPCGVCDSPPPMTEEEEFEFLEEMYRSPTRRPPQQAVYSPTTGAQLPIPQFDYGREDVDDPDRFNYMNRPQPTTPEFIRQSQQRMGLRSLSPSPSLPPRESSPQLKLPTEQEQQLQRAAAMTRAWEQEVRLRQGSPQAAEILQEAQVELEGEAGRRLRIGQDKMIEGSPPAGVKTPPREIKLPPKPLFSPTTGEPLPVPDYDIAPEQLGVSWEEDQEWIPELERTRIADYLYVPTMEEFEERSKRAQTDIFERCGDAYTAAVDTAPRRPQYFPPGIDIGTESPPQFRERIAQHQIPQEFFDPERPGMTKQSNIAVGAKRREQFLKRQQCPISQVAPIPDEPYLEYLHDKLAEHEYKGPVPQAKGLSPWREEDVYYTPSQGDSTLEDIDWPLASPQRTSPLRTPPQQLPRERPCGYRSPYSPPPKTPPPQRPEERPEGFVSPFIPGVSSPITPSYKGQYPTRRPADYETPPTPPQLLPDIPLEAFWDPLDYVGMGLSDVEGLEDDILPFESPEPFTPRDERRMPTPTRHPKTPIELRQIDLDRTPLNARRLFTDADESPCDPCGAQSSMGTPGTTRPTALKVPAKRQIATGVPTKGRIPTGIPSKSRIPSRGQIPSKSHLRGQATSKIPSKQSEGQKSIPCAQRPISEADLYQGTPTIRTPERPIGGTPRRAVERTSRRLFEGEVPSDSLNSSQQAIRRSPKHVTPPPRPASPVRPVWYTPEGMPGPSRRPTGLTPEGYNSDFEDGPPPRTPGSPQFAPAKRIKKRGNRPPSPTTPVDRREIPGLSVRPPCAPRSFRVLPSRASRPPALTSEPPVTFSPMEPFVPDEDLWVSPPPPPPQYYKDPMYFPPDVMDQPVLEYPTLEEIKAHQLDRDLELQRHSRSKRVTVGPRPYTYRDSEIAMQYRHRAAGTERLAECIPEFPDDDYWRLDMWGRKDIEPLDYINNPPSTYFRPYRPAKNPDYVPRIRSPQAIKDPDRPCTPCGREEDPNDVIYGSEDPLGEEEEDDGLQLPTDIEEDDEIFGSEDPFGEILHANLQVPPEQYPPPEEECRVRPPAAVCRPFEVRYGDEALLERSEAFRTAAERGNLSQHIEQRHFEEIAEQADLFFDTAGGLLDQTPPEQIGRNYYPDISRRADQLGRTIQRYDLPPSPVPSPFLRSPGTPPGLPPQWSPASVPSGSPRTPKILEAAPPSCVSLKEGKKGNKKPPKRKGPLPLKETKSSQLRKQLPKKVVEEKLSPISMMLKKRREKAQKAAEEKKKRINARNEAERLAEEQAKMAESMARVAEGLPGGPMRPRDYRAAAGTGEAPVYSAQKDIPQDMAGHEGAVARRKLFGRQPFADPGAAGQRGEFSGRKTLGRKGPGPPTGDLGRRDSDDDLATPLVNGGPEFAEELLRHEVEFPRRQMGVVVGGGKVKRLERKSKRAIDLMDEIGEEDGSPCGTCGGEDEYQAALRAAGVTAEQAAAVFDPRFLQEMEEEDAALQEEAGSPNAIQQLENQLREMDAYEKQQSEFWKSMAADLTDDELRDIGITRAELERNPCGTCEDAAPEPSTRPPEKRQLTQQQEQMLSQLQRLEDRVDDLATEPQRSPTEFERIEQEVIRREQEEREYFERMRECEVQARSPVRSPVPSPARQVPASRGMTEEEEQLEFEELERQMGMEQERAAPCAQPITVNETARQQELMMKRRLLEQQLQIQGPPIRGRPFPASGVTYSPPRPQAKFGPPPYEQRAVRLPTAIPQRDRSPPRQPTPPCRTPPRLPSPRIPSPPSPPPSPHGVLEETPPYFGEMEEEDRLPASPCRPRPPPVPRWSPTPSPPRAPSPPPFIPTPPSPPLLAAELRQHVSSMARPEYDPAARRDLLPREDRRAFRAPGVGLYNVQEEEPLIPELAGDESFMGWPTIPGERAPRKRRKSSKKKKPVRLFGDSDVSKMCRRLEKKFDLPPIPAEPLDPEEEYNILDDSIPDDLPRPIAPQWQPISPIPRIPLQPIPLAPWEGVGFRYPDRPSPGYPQPEMPVHTEIYEGGGPVHPDLADLVGYEPPLPIPEVVPDLGQEVLGEEMYFTPERYPEIDEMELDREAALAYQPPEVLKNIWLSSPQDLGVFTPPSVGKGPTGTYTPTATPPLQILRSPDLRTLDDDMLMRPGSCVPGQAVEEFFVSTPPLERVTSIQEMKYYTYRAKGREGIKPKPMYFGGYGETPQRPIPRWHGHGGARNVIQEVEVPFSPPTPGTPPPQFPAPLAYYSPELDEFQQLEQEMQQEEARPSRRSKQRQKREEMKATQRQMLLNELTEQAERKEMERRTASKRAPSPLRSPVNQSGFPHRSATPDQRGSPHIRSTTPDQRGFPYITSATPDQRGFPHTRSPEKQAEDGPCDPCGPPPIDHRALEEYMLTEMEFDPNADPQLTPPVTPDLMEQGMYDVFEGIESPPPLSPKPEGPCMPCTPPAPPSPPPYPDSPPKPQWQIYAEKMEREKRARQARENRRQQLYQSNLQEIQQMFGPSPGPPSPGPDADFYANVFAHQVSPSFRQGDRPRTAIRDQIGTREITLRIPRHTPAPGLAGSAITEQRVRIAPEQPRRRPPSRPTCATRRAPPPQVEERESAQRIAEARKHYQQMGRQRSRAGQRQGALTQPQLIAQPLENFLQQADQQQASQTAPARSGQGITPDEAQRKAMKRLRARRMLPPEHALPIPGTKFASQTELPSQRLQPFTGFLPSQVQRQMPRPPAPVQSVEEFIRGGPRPPPGQASCRAGNRAQLRPPPGVSGTQPKKQRRKEEGGCGGSCGSR